MINEVIDTSRIGVNINQIHRVIKNQENYGNVCRYYFDNILMNETYPIAERDQLMVDLKRGMDKANVNLQNMGNSVNVLSNDVARLNNRVENTERHLSIRQGATNKGANFNTNI